MAWSGYFMFGGTELMNATRTEEYAKHLGARWFRPVYNESSIPWLLDEPRYTTPLQDDAPWTDPDNLDSYDFYGAYPLEVTGIEDSTVEATATESVIDGGYIGRVRKKTRTVVFSAVLTGASECAVEYGMRWLRSVLTGGPCFNQAYGSCGGVDLCYLACPPVTGEIDPTYSPGAVAVTATNLAANPNLEGGVLTGWFSSSGGDYPISLDTFLPIGGTRSAVLTRAATNLNSTVGGFGLTGSSTYITAPAGTTFTFAVDVKTEMAARRIYAYVRYADGSVSGSTTYVPSTTAGGTYRIVHTATVPAGQTGIRLQIGVQTTGGNATAGERVWGDNLSIEKGTTPGTYFDGSTSVDGTHTYHWTGTPNASTSERHTQSYIQDPLPTGEDCYNRIGRSLHEVTTTLGPTVTTKLAMNDGGAAWQVTWTMVAANPAEFGVEKQLIVGFLDPKVTVPYVGGVVPPGGDFDKNGYVQSEAPCAVAVFRPVYDPTCGLLTAPPAVPSVVPMCFSFPTNFLRTSFVIPREEIPLWTTVAPVISLSTTTAEVRSVRVRFYADLFDTGDPSQDPCNYCGDVVFSYIPPSSTIVLDCADREVYIDQPGIGRRRADALVTDSKGMPFEWPEFSCGYGYTVTVDMPQQMTKRPVVDLSLVPRMA